jgi:hypothetical protein
MNWYYAAILVWPVIAVVFGLAMTRFMNTDKNPVFSEEQNDPRLQWLQQNEKRLRELGNARE